MSGLAPHGYEGMRAHRPAAFKAPALPVAPLAKLPAEYLMTPVRVGEPASPFRLHHHGICCGVFSNEAAAAHSIRLIANQNT